MNATKTEDKNEKFNSKLAIQNIDSNDKILEVIVTIVLAVIMAFIFVNFEFF